MEELYALRDHVFWNRLKSFHWNSERAFECNSGSILWPDIKAETVIGYKGTDTVESIRTGNGAVNEETVHNNHNYEENAFLIVKAYTTRFSYSPQFWIGRVTSTEKSTCRQTTKLFTRWYEQYSNGDFSSARFTPSFTPDSAGTQKARKYSIDTDTMLLNFESLTKAIKLSMVVQRYIQRDLSSLSATNL